MGIEAAPGAHAGRGPERHAAVLTGLRIATLQVIATATLGAYVGFNGLGSYIYEGFRQQDAASCSPARWRSPCWLAFDGGLALPLVVEPVGGSSAGYDG